MNIALIATLAKRLAAVCFVAVILWHLVPHSGALRGKAIVYVTEPDVTVDIDDQRYHVASLAESPLVRELEAGLHAAVVWRRGKRIGEEQFLVEPGQDVIVRATGRPGNDRAERRTSPAEPESRPPGLAVHFWRSQGRGRLRRDRTIGHERRRDGAGTVTSSSASSSPESPG